VAEAQGQCGNPNEGQHPPFESNARLVKIQQIDKTWCEPH
jgi:hypothetical protein